MSIVLALLLAVSAGLVGTPPSVDDPFQRLESWPEPADEKTLKKDVQRLRKARTPEMVVAAREGLRAAGAAAAPELLRTLGKEKDKEARARIVAALEDVTGAAHTRLLAEDIEHRSVAVRVFVLRRIATFPDPGLKEPAEKVLFATRKREDKNEPGEVFAAGLFAVSTGSLQGLTELGHLSISRWESDRDAFLNALAGVRGVEASKLLSKQLASDVRNDRLAAARLMAGCCVQGYEQSLKPLLDDSDPTVRTAAINALRAIVDGDPPLKRLPVFEAIERAQRWKERLG
jgi:hypothetical protein